MVPKRGPMARGAKAYDQPQCDTQMGTARMLTTVSKNPRQVCMVSAVPTYSAGASSVTHAENCAESATMLTPQISVRAPSTTGDAAARNARPMPNAQQPLITIAVIVMVVRPNRSASEHAATQPIAPAATARNAIMLETTTGNAC